MATTLTKLATANFRPKRILAQPDDVRKFHLGSLMGVVTGTVQRKSPDGEQTFTGLQGTFAFVDSDPKEEEIRSGVLFLPDAIQSPINELISQPDISQIRIVAEVYAIRANNAAGYSHAVEFIDEPGAVDPLEEARQMLLERRGAQAAIAAPKEGEPIGEGVPPVKEKAGSSK